MTGIYIFWYDDLVEQMSVLAVCRGYIAFKEVDLVKKKVFSGIELSSRKVLVYNIPKKFLRNMQVGAEVLS